MSKWAWQNTANQEMLDFGSPSSSTWGNELAFGTTGKAQTELLIINYAILNSFYIYIFQHFFTPRTLEILGWKKNDFWCN